MSNIRRTRFAHQIDIGWRLLSRTKLRDQAALNTWEMKRLYDGVEYRLWNGGELLDHIQKHYDRQLARLFALAPGLVKKRIGQYCLLHSLGGLYFDLSIKLIDSWNIASHCGVAAFRLPHDQSSNWTLLDSRLIWSEPGREEWTIVLDSILKRGAIGVFDFRFGAAELGLAFSTAMVPKGQSHRSDDQSIGEIRRVSMLAPYDIGFIAPDRALVGLDLARS